jgi:hypothetical protein
MQTYTARSAPVQTFSEAQAEVATPVVPAAPRAARSLAIPGPDGKTHTVTIPATRDEVRELTSRREAISDQLSNVSDRRSELAVQLATATDAVSRSGLEGRLRLLDQRILQLETDLAVTGQQLAAAPSRLVAEAETQSAPASPDDFEDGLMAGGFSALLLIPVLYFFARRRWKRKAVAPAAGRLTAESPRLERLEQGMEAIAIEIERISEGQRFVTKLLSESQSPLGTAQRNPRPAVAEQTPTKRD